MPHIMKCPQCGKYTLKDVCSCGGIPVSPRPPKYSLDDKYASYRRQAKRSELEQKGLL